MFTVLGFMNYASHDPGACIVTDKNGKVEYITISEERLSRVKYSYYFPVRAIKYCMEHFGLKSMDEIDLVVTDYGFRKQFSNTTRHYRKLEADYIKTRLNIPWEKIKYIDSHHMAHAASVFYTCPYEEAAVLVVDGFGSNIETNSLYACDKDGIRLIDKAYGQGIGIVYTAITMDVLGFGLGEEGKTMGLAPIGKNSNLEKILKLSPTYNGIVTDYSSFIDRCPGFKIKQTLPKCPNVKEVTNPYYSKIAYELQEETDRCMIHLANYAFKKTGMKNLCIAGGVGLNCVTNVKLLDHTSFENIFIQPAASDVGIPLGLALEGYASNKKKNLKVEFSNAYTGIKYDKQDILKILNGNEINYEEVTLEKVAQILATGSILGWFCGGSELGPRALGHRSILTDPRPKWMKDWLNERVKHREIFRPFAPSILKEKLGEYFHLKCESPYMLLAPMTKEEKQNEIPAVVHVDGSGRVQTVSSTESPEFYQLIVEFQKITGVPVILNTSYNDNGEPIVERPIDAILCFLRTNIDYLYIEGLLISKKDMKDVELKLLKVDSQRKSILKEEYRKSISIICNEKYSTEEMKEYLKCHYPMHVYYSKLHTYVVLQTKIEELSNNYESFVTDKYHVDILKNYLPESYFKISKKLIIVEDQIDKLEDLPKKSFVLLFNMAIYIKEPSSYNFYEDFSLLKLSPSFKMHDNKEFDFNNSNEYRSSKDWDGLYNDFVLK